MIKGYEAVPGNSAGLQTGGGWKILLHTTEGGTANGAIAAYKKNNSWPHFTISFEEGRRIQHPEWNQAARSLRNDADGYDTNRANVVQIEIVGYTRDCGGWSKAKLDFIARTIADIQDAGVKPALVAPDFSNPVRFSDKAFVEYSGIVGHCHAPDNTHYDPTGLDVQYIISRLSGTPSMPVKGAPLKKQIPFYATMKTDPQGNGYTDVYHGEGTDPTWKDAAVNGGFNKAKGYPDSKPYFWCEALENKFVRVTVIGAKPNDTFGFNVLMGW